MEADTAALVTAVDAMLMEMKFHEDAATTIRVALKDLRKKLAAPARVSAKPRAPRAPRASRRRGLAAVPEPAQQRGLDDGPLLPAIDRNGNGVQ